jgi:hypothetical protein
MNQNIFVVFLFTILIYACDNSAGKQESVTAINGFTTQETIFKSLVDLTNHTIPKDMVNDSLAFLILPVHASCPYCRKKTIDSILKYQNALADRHYIIISANAGRKTIASYFRERGKELPVVENKLFLDTANKAFALDLYDNRPTIYYAYNKKVFQKVASLPATVKDDLHRFFSGEGYYKFVAKGN